MISELNICTVIDIESGVKTVNRDVYVLQSCVNTDDFGVKITCISAFGMNAE